MRVLLDTNVFLRWAFDEKMPDRVERLISAPATDLCVSMITPWEIAIKGSRLRAKRLTNARVGETLKLLGAQVVPVTMKHIGVLWSLPEHHQDPFDRMLIAQAISEDAVVLSSDERFPLYKSAGLQVRWD